MNTDNLFNKKEQIEDANIIDYLNLQKQYPYLFKNDISKNSIHILKDYSTIEKLKKLLDERESTLGIVYKDKYFMLIKDAVQFPNGKISTYIRGMNTIDKHGRGVAIFPIFQNKIVLLKHFRHATREWHLEIPRGYGELNQTDEQNACRELFEETGSYAKRIIPIGAITPDTGILTNEVSLFFAELECLGQNFDKEEGIDEIISISLDEFKALVKANKITDAYTLTAFSKVVIMGLLK